MALLGAIVNALAIIVGSLLGKFLNRIPESMKTTVMNGLGLSVFVLGIQMGFKSDNFLIVISSIAIGGILGEWWDLDDKLIKLGNWVESKVPSQGDGEIAKGFVNATLIFVVGAMAIVGSLDSGLRLDHDVLYMKSLLDGFTSIILTATFGIGVLLSFIPVFLYEGLITLMATQIEQFVPKSLMDEFIVQSTATGGILIIAIGLNVMGLAKIKTANLLPSILVVGLIVTVLSYL